MTTGNLHTFLRGSKDAAIALAARTFVNTRFNRIGQMTELSVDTKKRTIRVRLELKGEDEPIDIHVKKYSLERRSTGATLTIGDAVASREWLTEAMKEFVIGRRFTIPERAAAILKLLT
jgi:hypothetical protein